MRHGLFVVGSAGSVVVLVGTCALWVRSYDLSSQRSVIIHVGDRHEYFCVLSESGGVVVKFTPDWPVERSGVGEVGWASCRETESWDRPFPTVERRCGYGRCRVLSGVDEFYDDDGRTLNRPGVAISLPFA